jgi:hypothetical protein
VNTDSKDPEAAKEVPAVKPKISIVVILAMLLGVLLALGGASVFIHYKSMKVLHADLVLAKKSVHEKNLAIEEMKAQIEALSRQMDSLKEYSVARSGSGSKKAGNNVSAPNALAGAAPSSDAKEKAGSPETQNPPKAKKPKANVPNCDLVGKSPEDQASTLKRCVGAMDGSTN